MLAWQWHSQEVTKIIIVNFSESVCQSRLWISTQFNQNKITFTDDLAGTEYQRRAGAAANRI